MRVAVALTLLLAGCGDDGKGTTDGGVRDLAGADFAVAVLCEDTQVGDAGLAPTFANVQQVFDRNCVGCHCCGDALDLTNGRSYAQLVNRMTPNSSRDVDESCGGRLVTPGDAGASYLYQKITPSPPCAGQSMPLQEFQFVPLPECQRDVVRRWIAGGAANN